MRLGPAMAGLALAAFLPAAPVHALCGPFTDVDSGGFCGSVLWIKNRNITLGCDLSGTLYCPNTAVSRLAMAAFMNRLGNVLTPLVLDEEQTGTTLDLPAGPFYVCESETVEAVAYPRTVVAQASISFELGGVQDVRVGVSTAVDGGAYSFGGPIVARNGAGQHQIYYVGGAQSLAVGSTYRFAMRVDRVGSQPTPLGAWACHLQVEVANAFGSQ